jgi:hypothetical protein
MAYLFTAIFSFLMVVTSLPLSSAQAGPENGLSVVEKFRGNDRISLPALLKSFSKVNWQHLSKKDQDIILKGRQIKSIVEITSQESATWQEVVFFEVDGTEHQLNLLISADQNKLDIQPLFLGQSISSPELFYDIAYPVIYSHLCEDKNLNIKCPSREEFLKNVTFYIKKISETAKGEVLEDWQVHYGTTTYNVRVKFTPHTQGRYTFSLA